MSSSVMAVYFSLVFCKYEYESERAPKQKQTRNDGHASRSLLPSPLLAGSRAKLSRTCALGGGGGKKSVKLVHAVNAEITRFFAVCGSEKARVDKDNLACPIPS
jgi:hypothetical protein